MHFHGPGTISEAFDLLAGGDARPLLGGTDLVVGLRHGKVRAEHVVDLKRIRDLPPWLIHEPGGVRIGATATLSALVAEPFVQHHHPALVEAAAAVGSVQIRNRASLVGNVCNASPAADTVPSLLVHQAIARISSPQGERDVPLARFFHGPGRTACAPTELVTSVFLPTPPEGSGSASLRLTRRHGVDLATVSAAVHIGSDGRVGVGLGAVGPRPLLVDIPAVEIGDEPALLAAVLDAVEVATPISDVRASREYRLAMIRTLARRAAVIAARRAGWGGAR